MRVNGVFGGEKKNKIPTNNKVKRVDAITHTISCWHGRTNEKKKMIKIEFRQR